MYSRVIEFMHIANLNGHVDVIELLCEKFMIWIAMLGLVLASMDYLT